MTEFINHSGLEFTDISSEEYREYEFPNLTLRLENPLYLNVSKSGGHRVFCADGVSHYIYTDGRHLSWKAKPNQPNFVA